MNGLDVAIAAIAVVGALYGLARGALRMATSLVSLGAAVYLASIYYSRAGAIVGRELRLGPAMASVVGYAVVFIAVFAAVEITGSIAVRLARAIHLSWIDRLLGGVLGAAVALALTGLALMLLAALLPADAPLLRNSQLAPRVLGYSQGLVDFIPPEIKQTYQHKRRQLEDYWIARALASPAPTPLPAPQSRQRTRSRGK